MSIATLMTWLKGIVFSSAVKELLIGLGTTGILLILSKTTFGRHLRVVVAGKLSRIDAEQALEAWKTAALDLRSLGIADASIYSLQTGGMPTIKRHHGALPPEFEWMEQQKILSEAITQRADVKVNKSHAFVVGDDFRRPGTSVISYVSTDYAMVRAASKAGLPAPILSANALVFCPATKRLILMLRDQSVRTYKNALHFLGGNYEPATGTESFDDFDPESPLRRTALREIEEESNLVITKPRKGLVLVGEEHTTGFVQFTYLAFAISEWQAKSIKPSREGAIVAVSLNELIDFAKTGKLSALGTGSGITMITPSCALAILTWLRLGVPNEFGETPIRKDALRAYDEVRPRIVERLATAA